MKILTNNDIKALFLDYTFENGGNKCPTLSSVRARLLNVNYINITANHNETNRLITSISATKQQDTPDVPEETVFTGEWITTDIGIGLDRTLIFWQSELDKTNTIEFEGCDYLAPARDDIYGYVEDHGVLIGRYGSTSNIKKDVVPHIDLDSLTFTINGDAVSVSIDGLNLTNLVAHPVGLRPGKYVSSLKFIATGQVSVLNSAQEVIDTTTLLITAVINTLDLPDDCKAGAGPDDYYDFNNEGITLRGRLYIDGEVVLNDKVYTIHTNEITNFSC